MKNFSIFLGILCALAFAGPTISLQGYFKPVSPQTPLNSIEVSLFYDTSSTAVWIDRFESIPLKSGVFHLELGSNKSLDGVDFSKDMWFQLTINDVVGSFKKITTVPTSLSSRALKGHLHKESTIDDSLLVRSLNGIQDDISLVAGEGLVLEQNANEISLSLNTDSILTGTQGPQGEKGEPGEQGPPGEEGPKGDTGKGLQIDGECDAAARAENTFPVNYTCFDETTQEIFVKVSATDFLNLGRLSINSDATSNWDRAYEHALDSTIHFTNVFTKRAAERTADSTQSGLLSQQDWNTFFETFVETERLKDSVANLSQLYQNHHLNIVSLSDELTKYTLKVDTLEQLDLSVDDDNLVSQKSVHISNSTLTLQNETEANGITNVISLLGKGPSKADISLDTNGNMYIGPRYGELSSEHGKLTFRYGFGATGAVLDGDGNFGIANLTPEEKLHVGGNARVDGDLEISGNLIYNGVVEKVISQRATPSFLDANMRIVFNDSTETITTNIPISTWTLDSLEALAGTEYSWTGYTPYFASDISCNAEYGTDSYGEEPLIGFGQGLYTMTIHPFFSQGYNIVIEFRDTIARSEVLVVIHANRSGGNVNWSLYSMKGIVNYTERFYCSPSVK